MPADARILTVRKLVTAVAAIAAAAIVVAAPATARTSGAHWCRQGDPPVYASARTGCPLAGNMITEYVNVCRESRNCVMGVSSPNSRRRYRVSCHRTGGRYSGIVYCEAPAGTGIWARFSALI
jgi:hypothetical protein